MSVTAIPYRHRTKPVTDFLHPTATGHPYDVAFSLPAQGSHHPRQWADECQQVKADEHDELKPRDVRVLSTHPRPAAAPPHEHEGDTRRDDHDDHDNGDQRCA